MLSSSPDVGVYGPNELGPMAQLTRGEACGSTKSSIADTSAMSNLGVAIGAAILLLALLAMARARARAARFLPSARAGGHR